MIPKLTGDRFIGMHTQKHKPVPIELKVKKSYDRYAQNYDADTPLQRSLADKLASAVQSDDVGAIHELPLQILDVGCGTGYAMQEICGGGVTPPLHFVGCDISFDMLSHAKYKRPGLYVQSDACHLSFDAGSFDMVVSNAAYQWVPDLKAAFREAKRVLKLDGKFYFTIFNKNTLWQLQDICREINIASSAFPDKDNVSSTLADAGLGIVSIETFSYKKYYKDLWEMLFALKKIGSNSADNKNIAPFSWRRILSQANDLYAVRFANENGIPATYEAFLVKAVGTLSHD